MLAVQFDSLGLRISFFMLLVNTEILEVLVVFIALYLFIQDQDLVKPYLKLLSIWNADGVFGAMMKVKHMPLNHRASLLVDWQFVMMSVLTILSLVMGSR